VSLSDRLKIAEQARRQAAGLPDEPSEPAAIDLTTSGEVIDLTTQPGGIAYNPVRSGDASSAFGDFDPATQRRAEGIECPRCGAATHLDLFDQVHQTASLSCTSCFHMFRVEIPVEV